MSRLSALRDSAKYSAIAPGAKGLSLCSTVFLARLLTRMSKWPSAAWLRLTTRLTIPSIATDSSSSSGCTRLRVSSSNETAGALESYCALICSVARISESQVFLTILWRCRRRERMASKNSAWSALLAALSAISKRLSSALSNISTIADCRYPVARSRTLIRGAGSTEPPAAARAARLGLIETTLGSWDISTLQTSCTCHRVLHASGETPARSKPSICR